MSHDGYVRIPVEDHVASEEEQAGLFSKLMFTWVTPMVNTGYERALEEHDLLGLCDGDKAHNLSRRWDDQWEKELEKSKSWDHLIGKRVRDDNGSQGTLRWIGRLTKSQNPDDFYAGVEWDAVRRNVAQKGGKTTSVGGDGWFYHEKKFECREGHASFIKPILLTPIETIGDIIPPRPITPSTAMSLAHIFGWELFRSGLFKLGNDVSQYVGPICLEKITDYLNDDDPGWGNGLVWVAVFFASQLFQSLCANQYFYEVGRVGMRMRQSISCAVFDKSLIVDERTRADPDLSVGRIVNLMSTDAQRAFDVIQMFHQLWSAPFQIVLCSILLWRLIGVSLFAGIAMMFILSPAQGKLMRKMMGLREELSKISDERLKAVTEFLTGVRIIKFMVWGQRALDQLNGIRNREVDKLRVQQNYRVMMFSIIYLTPVLMTSSSFIVYNLLGGEIDNRIFPAISLFMLLRFPFLSLPLQFNQMINAKVSMDRLTVFLEAKERNDAAVHAEALRRDEADAAIVIKNGNFIAYEPQKIPDLAPEDVQVAPRVAEGAVTSQQGSPQVSPAGAKKKKKKAPPKKAHYKIHPKPVLSDVNVHIRKGKLTMIIGPTGGGKTCLLEAMIGAVDALPGTEMRRTGHDDSHGFKPGHLAYAPQQAWMMNATLKNNIVFFKEDDDKLYERVVHSCQLAHDLTTLDYGDQTEIGEKGINLSGGQKARVSLARAVYSEKELVLLDDPLSAVDPHVAKELMKQVIGTSAKSRPGSWPDAMLHGKTRVLVTHQIQFAHHADDIIYVDGGRVVAQFVGNAETSAAQKIAEFVNRGEAGGEFLLPIANQKVADEEDSVSPNSSQMLSPVASPGLTTKDSKTKGRIITTEERAQGAVSMHMYLSYMKGLGGPWWCVLVLFLFALNQGALQMCDFWLTWWTEKNEPDSNPPFGLDSYRDHWWIYIYITLIVSTGVINLCRGFAVYSRFQAASRYFHEQLAANVLRSTVAFFDTTPIGRLINRFSKDIDQVDTILPPTVVTFFQLMISVFAYLLVIATSQPAVFAMIVPAAYVYIRILSRFISSNRETKRLDSINKSPIYQHFTETLTGMKTLQCYGVEEIFRQENRTRLDLNTKTTFSNLACNRWLAIRLELLGNVFACLTALLAVCSKHISAFEGGGVAMLSLGITYSMQLTGQLNFLVRQVADLEAQMNGVERIVEFSEDIEQEPVLAYKGEVKELPFRGQQYMDPDTGAMGIVRTVPLKASESCKVYFPHADEVKEIPRDDTKQLSEDFEYKLGVLKAPAEGWPATGEVTFTDVHFRYRPGLPLVLKGLGGMGGLTIGDREKVGIVGRTGAGKSTLMLALFRFVELAGGSICIGGRDIKTVKLSALRSALSMIPQDPVLFQGTIKSNLDPFGQSSSQQIWARLEQVNMKGRIESHDNQLDGAVTEGGLNFSVGQRQLLCLARALLKRNSKILLMDEATASIDHATDMAIQRTVREHFKDYTVLTIAHRLQTIMDSTRIMVLDQGICAEYDTPSNLLADPNSILYDMAQKTGDFERLHDIATGKIGFLDALEQDDDKSE